MEDNIIDDVLIDRKRNYGEFSDVAFIYSNLVRVITDFYEDTFNEKENIDPVIKCALDMLCMKIARIVSGESNYRDNWVDLAGYSTLVIRYLDKIESRLKNVNKDKELDNCHNINTGEYSELFFDSIKKYVEEETDK